MTTPSLWIDAAEVTRAGTDPLLSVGERLTITTNGSSGRTVAAEITGLTWDDGSGGTADTEQPYHGTIDLAEGPAGAYTGTFTIPAAFVRVTDVTLSITDGSRPPTPLPGGGRCRASPPPWSWTSPTAATSTGPR